MDFNFLNQLNEERKKKNDLDTSEASEYEHTVKQTATPRPQRETPEERKERKRQYEELETWRATALPEETVMDAPVQFFDLMRQDEEAGTKQWWQTTHRALSTFSKLQDNLVVEEDYTYTTPTGEQKRQQRSGIDPFKLGGDVVSTETFIEQHPIFRPESDETHTNINQLGKAQAWINRSAVKLRGLGLEVCEDEDEYTQILGGSYQYLRQTLGPRALSRIKSADRKKLIASVMTQELIRNAEITDENAAIEYVVPKVRASVNRVMSRPYPEQRPDSLFLDDMQHVRQVVDELGGWDQTARFSEAFQDSEYTAPANLIYTLVTGDRPPDGVKISKMRTVLGAALSKYEEGMNKSGEAYKWHLCGIDLPIDRLGSDGRFLAPGELPGAEESVARILVNRDRDMAYSQVSEHAEERGIEQLRQRFIEIGPMRQGAMLEFLNKELGIARNEAKNIIDSHHRRTAQSSMGGFSYGAYSRAMERKPAQDINDQWRRLRQIAAENETVREKLLLRKHQYSKEWIRQNEQKLIQQGQEQQIDPKALGEFIERTHKRAEERSEAKKKHEDRVLGQYLVHATEAIPRGLMYLMTQVPGFKESAGAIHTFLRGVYSKTYDDIPDAEKRALNMPTDIAITEHVRRKLYDALNMDPDPMGARNRLADKIATGNYIPILDQIGVLTQEVLHGFMDIPFRAVEDPAGIAAAFGGLKLYNQKSVGWAKSVAKKAGRPGLEPVLLFATRPHEFFANATKAQTALLGDRILFGTNLNHVRKKINKMPPKLRRQYLSTIRQTADSALNSGAKDVRKAGRAMQAVTDYLASKWADSEYEAKLSRMDMQGIREKAKAADISFEAAQALFGMPFGEGRLVDGTLAKHMGQEHILTMRKFENDVVNNAVQKTGLSTTEAHNKFIRAYTQWASDRSANAWGRAEDFLRRHFGMEGSAKEFEAVRDFFRRKYNYEKSAAFDRNALEEAIKANRSRVEISSAKQHIFEGFAKRQTLKIMNISERLKALRDQPDSPKLRKHIKELQGRLEVAKRQQKIALQDAKTLRQLSKSHIVERKSVVQKLYSHLENGWQSMGDRAYKKAVMNFAVNSSIFNHRMRARLGKIFKLDHDEIEMWAHGSLYKHTPHSPKIREGLVRRFGEKRVKKAEDLAKLPVGNTLARRQKALHRAMRKMSGTDPKTEEAWGLFADKPPFRMGEFMRSMRDEMRRTLAYISDPNNLRHGGMDPDTAVFARPLTNLVTAMHSLTPGTEAGRRMRIITQRVDNMGQGLMGRIDRVGNKKILLGEADSLRASQISKLPESQITKMHTDEAQRIGLEMRRIHDELIRAQYSMGLITADELKHALGNKLDSHFYLDKRLKPELRKLETRDNSILYMDTAETPKHSRLNIQRKLDKARVAWYNTAEGRWEVRDFESNKKAKQFQNEMLKTYKNLKKDDIRVFNKLTEEETALLGLVNDDGDYQIDSMRNMVHDLAKNKLMNEIGVMQGLVRTKIPDSVVERGNWIKVGGDRAKMSPAEIRQQNLKWGNMAGKYIHVSFLDQLSTYDDATGIIRTVADSFSELLQQAESQKAGGPVARFFNGLSRSTLWSRKYVNITSRHLRRNLITTNATSYGNNFLGALIFSHMSGAKVFDPGFWKGLMQADHWSNFGKLLDEIGTRRFETLDPFGEGPSKGYEKLTKTELQSVRNFKYAVDRGLVERSGEGVFTGGRRRGEKRLRFRDAFRDIDETHLRRFRTLERRRNELGSTIDKMDQLIADEKIPDSKLRAFRERREAYVALKKQAERDMGKQAIRNELQKGLSLPDKALVEFKGWMKADPETTAHRLVAQSYGNIDPHLKWRTFRQMVEDMGLSKQAALERVLDFHQNYGVIHPAVRALKKVPVLGAFVPSFPAEAARILKNGLIDNPMRLLSPLMAVSAFNMISLSSKGLLPSDFANLTGIDNTYDFIKDFMTKAMISLPGGRLAILDTARFTPFGPLLESSSVARQHVEKMKGTKFAPLIPLANFGSNFVLNTPGTDLLAKHAFGVDPWTGRVTMRQGFERPLHDLAADAFELGVPRAISRPIKEAKDVMETPMSPITKRNVTVLEAALRSAGASIQIKSKDEQIANLALSYHYKKDREKIIKNYISLDKDVRHRIFELSEQFQNNLEFQQELINLSDDLLKQKKEEIRIGGETIKLGPYNKTRRKKIMRNIINKAANNVYNVIEEINPVRKLHFIRAIKNTWGSDEPAFKHAVKTLTNWDYVSRLSDIDMVADTAAEAGMLLEKTADAEMKSVYQSVWVNMVARAAELMTNSVERKRRYARDLLRATKGDRKRKIMEAFARQAGLLE